jgi:CDP-diacylglycerol--serine O-phosphatidyltransferase
MGRITTEQGPPRKRRPGVYLLPNLFTTAALFAGFYAIVAAMGDKFEKAAIAIFIAMVLDGMDGRIARLTHTQSDFGAEYDSLSDMVAFGLAPALVMYVWALSYLGKLGWLGAFLYAAATALRLARFNTQVAVADKNYFQGLPSPAAACILAALVWSAVDLGLTGATLSYVAMLLTVMSALLMVSNLRYHSLKGLDFKRRVPFVNALSVVLIFVLVAVHPPEILFVLFLLYAASGPLLTLLQLRKRRAARRGQSGEATRER